MKNKKLYSKLVIIINNTKEEQKMSIKKTLLFLLVSLNIFPITYKVSELLNLYEKNSSQSELKELSNEKNKIKLNNFEVAQWKDLSIGVNPIFTKDSNDFSKVYGLSFAYQNLFYEVGLNEKSKKESELYGYENNFYKLFFERDINRKIIKSTIEIDNLEMKKELLAGKKLLIEKIFKLKFLEWQKKLLRENLVELSKEKEMLEKKLLIGEASFFHLILNEKEKLNKENLLEKQQYDLDILEYEIKLLTGIKEEFSIDYVYNENIVIKKDLTDLIILELNKVINGEKIKDINYALSKKIDFSYQYDNLEKSSITSIKFQFNTFENSDKKLLSLEKDEITIKEKDEKNSIEIEYKNQLSTLNFLQKENQRLEKYYGNFKLIYDEMKLRFEKGNISYSDFIKIKSEFSIVEEEYLKTKIELDKFLIIANLYL